MCAYPDCRKPLIADAPAASGDPHAVLGQMAHIVAHSAEGPRGAQAFRGADRDGAENLVLLCPKHHILVDQQRKSHPVDWLYRMKEQHERWVTERLSPQERFLQAHPSTRYVTDTLHSTLLPVTHMPPAVFSAPCALAPLEIQQRLISLSPQEAALYKPFLCHENRLVTFCDLSAPSGPFSRCVDHRASQRQSSQLWWRDPDLARLYVMLLNRTLNKITGRRGLQLDKEHRRYYFEPVEGPQPREVSYHSLQGNRTSRQVAWQPMTRKTGLPKHYWEHLAIGLQFHRMGDASWCLSLRPERRFTLDGYIPLEGKQTGRKSTRRAARLHNYDLLTELNFWREFLSDGAPRIICAFGTQHLVIETELIHTSVTWPGVPEDSRPFSNRRIQEGLFSYADYQAVLSSELGEEDEWEDEEWASEGE